MPYLSLVIAASNADYGGAFLQRLQRCLDDKWLHLPVDTEIIIVEWNPPLHRPFINQVISWNGEAKVIRVSRDLHKRFFNPGQFTFLEYMAKNVGIRRATGEFILCTNADVIFSLDMHQRLCLENFSEECFYRANRHDLDEHGAVYQINFANGSFPPDSNVIGLSKTGVPWRENMTHFNASGDFMLMSRTNWHRLRGYPENTGYLVTLDGEMVHLAASHGLRQVIFPEAIMHQHHHHGNTDCRPWYHPPQGWSDLAPRGTTNPDESWGLNGWEL